MQDGRERSVVCILGAAAGHCTRIAQELGLVHVAASGGVPAEVSARRAVATDPSAPLLLEGFPSTAAEIEWVERNLGPPELVVLMASGEVGTLSYRQEG
jgi:hypothetical protein